MSKNLLSAAVAAICLLMPVAGQAADPTLAGFDYSDASPVGRQFAWPAGVRVVGPIHGYNWAFPGECDPEPDAVKGSGSMVQLCLSLTYDPPEGVSSQLPIVVTIPVGLTFESEAIRTQNGIVIKKVLVEIRPGQTVHLPLALMCMNVGRSASAADSLYRLGPITTNEGFLRFFALLENKRVPVTVFEGDGSGVTMLQDAVFDLSKGLPLKAATLAAINALPEE